MAAREMGEAGGCNQMKVFNTTPLFPAGHSLIIFLDAPQDLPDDKTVDNSDFLSLPTLLSRLFLFFIKNIKLNQMDSYTIKSPLLLSDPYLTQPSRHS